jgi:hypothetical protein
MSSIMIDGRYVFMDDLKRMGHGEQYGLMKTWFEENYDSLSVKSVAFRLLKPTPVYPENELLDAFGSSVPSFLIEELASDLEQTDLVWFDIIEYVHMEDLYSSEDPSIEFYNSLTKNEEIIEINRSVDYITSDVAAHMNALLHTSIFSSLEKFLVSTFISVVFSTDRKLSSFISIQSRPPYKSPQYSIIDILNGPEYINSCIDDYKRGLKGHIAKNLSWHSMKDVLIRFDSVGIELDFDITELERLIEIRHGLVHRDGYNSEGKAIRISGDELEATIREVVSFVELVRQKTGGVLKC